MASRGDVVLTERVRFVVGGKEIALPVAGVFEVRDGKIAAWAGLLRYGELPAAARLSAPVSPTCPIE